MTVQPRMRRNLKRALRALAGRVQPVAVAVGLCGAVTAAAVGMLSRSWVLAVLVAVASLALAAAIYVQHRSVRLHLAAIHAATRTMAGKGIRSEPGSRGSSTHTGAQAAAPALHAPSPAAAQQPKRMAGAGPVGAAAPVRQLLTGSGGSSLAVEKWHVRVDDDAVPSTLVTISPDEPTTFAVPVRGGGRFEAEFSLRSPSAAVNPSALQVDVQYVGTDGEPVGDKVPTNRLAYTPGALRQKVSLVVPGSAAAVRFTVRRGGGNIPYRLVNSIEVRQESLAARGRGAHDVRVAFIADTFTFNSFRDECDAVAIEPGRWREQFEEHAPQMLFCESAWAGVTPEREWRGKVYASNAWEHENRKSLLEIIAYCRANGIPTVFWNKEDPSHYYDRRHDFVRTATQFDHVLTTDESCVDRYRIEWGARSVSCLPFAAQPRLYNPGEAAEREPGSIVFAGSWYTYHVARSAAMESIFDGILAHDLRLDIYDRYHGDDDPHHFYPERYRDLTRPAVPHSDLAQVYKKYEFGLNFNTETRSRTMFARRVFELAMSGTLVVSNYSAGVERFFGEGVIFADKEPDRIRDMDADDRLRLREQNLDLVLRDHTYAQRFRQILDLAGISYEPDDGSVDLLATATNRKTVESILDTRSTFGDHVGRTMVVVPRTVDPSTVQELYRYAGDHVQIIAEEFAEDAVTRGGAGRAFVLGSRPVSLPDLDRGLLHLAYAEGGVALTGTREYDYGGVGDEVSVLLPQGAAVKPVLDGTVRERLYRI